MCSALRREEVSLLQHLHILRTPVIDIALTCDNKAFGVFQLGDC